MMKSPIILPTCIVLLAAMILSLPWLSVAVPGGENMGPMARRMLARRKANDGLEDVLLEPPSRGSRRRQRTKYLPDVMEDSLEGYPRRVFIDVVVSPSMPSSAGWFRRHYPKRDVEFETIRVEASATDVASANVDGMSKWLRQNVKEDEYVVLKADAEVVEEMVKGRVLMLVDELFLECKNNQWERRKGRSRSRRAYWECLALYGKLKDQGVAVHQWWG